MGTQELSITTVLLLLAQAFWLVSVFMLLQYVVIRMIKREGLHDWLAFYVPLIRNVLWVFFMVHVIYTFGKSEPVLVVFITAITLALAWPIVRDFIQGTVFRFQKGDIVGQQLQLTNYIGKVISMGETKLNLGLKDGEIVQIPYQRLLSEVLIKPINSRQIKSETLVFSVSKNNSVETIERSLTKKIIAYPWVVSKNGVVVECFSEPSEQQRKVKLAYSISTSSKSILIQEDLTSFIATL